MLKEFCIPFSGLKNGEHQFHFKLEESFFEHFETSQVQKVSLEAQVVLDKRENMLVFTTSLEGTFGSICDRCGEDLSLPLNDQFELVVKFGPKRGHSDEEILVLGPADWQVDMSHYLFEYTHLALPSRMVHSDETECDTQMLDLLDAHTIGSDEEEQPPTDPRWDSLKKLKDGDNL